MVDQINCKHEWHILTPDRHNAAGVTECKKCGLWLYHSNRLQLEMNRYELGFQRWVSIITIIISVIALITSIVAIYR